MNRATYDLQGQRNDLGNEVFGNIQKPPCYKCTKVTPPKMKKRKKKNYKPPQVLEELYPTYEPCVHIHFKQDLIDRECLTHGQYLDMLATPKGYRWMGEVDCDNPELDIHSNKKRKRRKPRKREPQEVRPDAGDFADEFVEDMWDVMTPAITDRLIDFLINEFGMSVQEAEDFIDCKSVAGKQTVCRKKKSKTVVAFGPKHKWVKEFSDVFAKRVEQYIVSMLLTRRTQRAKRIAERILEYFCDLTGEKTTLQNPKTKVQRTMVLIADRLALWIDDLMKDIDKPLRARPSITEEEIPESEEEEEEKESDKEGDGEGKKDGPVKKEPKAKKETKDEKEAPAEAGDKAEEEEKPEEEAEKESEPDEKPEPEPVQEKLEEEERPPAGKQEEEPEPKPEPEPVAAPQDELQQEEKEPERPPPPPEKEEEAQKEAKPEAVAKEPTQEEETAPEEQTKEAPEVAEGEETPKEKGEEEEKAESVAGEGEEETVKEEEEQPEGEQPEEEEEAAPSEEKPAEEIPPEKPIEEVKKPYADIFDIIKEDIAGAPKDKRTDRQQAIKDVVDRRIEKIMGKDVLGEVPSEDVDDAASRVAHWVEQIMGATETKEDAIRQKGPSIGGAFQVRPKTGSTLEVQKLSSGTVAEATALARGLQPPPRERKIPASVSPMNVQSAREWVEWATNIATVAEEWGNWLDSKVIDAEKHLADKKKDTVETDWKQWKEQAQYEAEKWRVEKERIRGEGKVWNKKINEKLKQQPEQEVRSTELEVETEEQ